MTKKIKEFMLVKLTVGIVIVGLLIVGVIIFREGFTKSYNLGVNNLFSVLKSSVDGVCGINKYTCNFGAVINQGISGNNYIWVCQGENGGKNANCSLPVEIDGQCGTVKGTCITGNPTKVILNSSTNKWKWTCEGKNGGKSQICSIPDGIDFKSNGIVVVDVSKLSEGCNHVSVSNKSKCIEKYADPYLGYYYVADHTKGSDWCKNIRDVNIKNRCIDKKANSGYVNDNYGISFYEYVYIENIEQAKYMLYAINGKLLIEKKSSNCSEGYSIGEFPIITIILALYRQSIKKEGLININLANRLKQCGDSLGVGQYLWKYMLYGLDIYFYTEGVCVVVTDEEGIQYGRDILGGKENICYKIIK